MANSTLVAAAALLLLLALHPQSRFYPACPIKELLGIQCPGCGATRALAALLHGHLREALRQNALFVGALPWLAAITARSYRNASPQTSFQLRPASAWTIYPAFGATLIFTIARNL